ncbi:MAG TPA: hypothetical protein EYP65_01680, partial [Armatimonadetes bacterium]|nr:hypothetical protein [Armatimonadota bacterium]
MALRGRLLQVAMRVAFEPEAPRWPILCGCVFLVSGAVLAYEVALTRLFSAFLRYHFVFLVVSVAVLGLGLGALLGRAVKAFLLPSLLFALSVLSLHVALMKWGLISLASTPALLAPILSVPFLFAGWFMASSFRAGVKKAGALYFSDLAGAATAAVLAIFALDAFGGIGTPLVVAAVAGMAPFALGASFRRVVGMGLSALTATVAISLLAQGGLSLPTMKVESPILKPLFSHLGRPGWPERI